MDRFFCEVEEKKFSKGPCFFEKGGMENAKTCLDCDYYRNHIASSQKHQAKGPPKAQEKGAPLEVAIITPRKLAEAYLSSKSFFHERIISDTLFQGKKGPDETLEWLAQRVYGDQSKYGPVTSLTSLKLPASTKKQIYTALANFTLAISIATRENVKSKIEGKSKKREDRKKLIGHLEKARNIASKHSDLIQIKQQVEEALDRLKTSTNIGQNYSQLSEIDYILSLFRSYALKKSLNRVHEIFKQKKEEINKSDTISPNMIYVSPPDVIETLPLPGRGTPQKPILTMEENVSMLRRLDECESRLTDPLSQELKKLNDSLSAMKNMKMKQSRPQELFLKAMLKVIYGLLSEEREMSVGEAKEHTANIANEYLRQRGFPRFANLDYDDVNHAIHY